MRWIIIILFIVNAGFFSWQYYAAQQHGEGEHAAAMDDPHGHTLTLMSEVEEASKQAADQEAATTAEMGADTPPADEQHKSTAAMAEPEKAVAAIPSAGVKEHAEPIQTKPDAHVADKAPPKKDEKTKSSGQCYALGPLKNQATVDKIKARVTSMSLRVDGIRNEVESIPTNWIYLGPYKTERDAKSQLQRLTAKGIKDTQLIHKGDENIIVSVGLFSTKEAANERLKNLQEAGFTPVVSTVTAKKSHYWLDVSYKNGRDIDKGILESLVRGIQGAAVVERTCQVK